MCVTPPRGRSQRCVALDAPRGGAPGATVLEEVGASADGVLLARVECDVRPTRLPDFVAAVFDNLAPAL